MNQDQDEIASGKPSEAQTVDRIQKPVVGLFETRYRIVMDSYNGYEAQYKRWWWPCWMQIGINTSLTVEAARRYCDYHARRVIEYYQPNAGRQP